MKSLLARNLGTILLAVLVFGQALMIGEQIGTASNAPRIRHWARAALLPVQGLASAAFEYGAERWERYVWLVGMVEKNQRLDADAERLRIENHYLQRRLLQFEARDSLEGFRRSLASHTLPARVIGQGASRSTHEIFIDRGRSHGVRQGMAVVTSEGVVGKIETVYAWASMVLLITDLGSGVGVFLERSGAPAILRGESRDECRLDYFSSRVQVEDGELVYSSGLDGIFPQGMPVGKVTRVESEDEERSSVRVTPLAALDRLGDVLVVVKGEHEALPESVQQSLARQHSEAPGQPGSLFDGLSEADRIKAAYRNAAELQGAKVGQLRGNGPTDFSGAIDALRASRNAESGEGGVP